MSKAEREREAKEQFVAAYLTKQKERRLQAAIRRVLRNPGREYAEKYGDSCEE